jgi:pyridoxal phosphate enzyme (YggS family)
MPDPANTQRTETDIAGNLQRLKQRIAIAAEKSGRRPETIQLVAVSKTKPLSSVQEALAAGQQSFGENYAQELAEKAQQQAADWHFIGPLQSNKTKLVVNAASWVHSVDRLKIAQRLSAMRDPSLPALNICLQVNISAEEQKSGVLPQQLEALLAQLQPLPRLRLRGLMCIPKRDDSEAFWRMAALAEELRGQGYPLDTLSMGMSHDFEDAILAGATHVRVGTALFGSRT